ncbi:MAG: gamma-glutamyltransferase [Gammaproteobacteria bacterium]|nr:gamma-glutamyltransferase [Gammaproteobacteria bacterium]MDH3507635.1 gamma-glutamyltransferase [Gammaproteobacteria bacterium]
MDRRNFLKVAGAAPAALVAAPELAQATGPFLNTELLAYRNNNRSTVACQNGIVCASQPLAAMVGIDILKAGGNCIDAAIAVNATLGLTEPHMNGVGGDLFAIVWSQLDQRLFGLNASGRAPYSWDLERAGRRELNRVPRVSPLSWTVPGCVSGWALLNERFGSLSLAACLEPAIGYAQAGFPLSPVIAQAFEWPALLEESGANLASVYRPNGRTPTFGEIFRNPLLARTYRQIGEEGAAAFYEGEIAERIVAKSDELGGEMSLRDLADHSANWVTPLSTSYRGFDVWELPPNSQGITVLQMLNLLEHFELSDLEPNSAEHLHLLIEAKKLAYEDRARYYADPEFADVPVEWLISKDYAAERVELIDPRRASRSVRPGDPELDSDTIYMTAADNDGNMISLIQSNYSEWGSALVPEGVGFAMHNRGVSYSLDPGHPNRLEPHKRPFHTIIPAFVTENGAPLLSFGVMGGAFQPQGHSQVLMNMLDFGMSPQQAGDQPRVEHIGSSEPATGLVEGGGTVRFERGVADEVKLALAEMGHELSGAPRAAGGYQAIWRTEDPRVYFGGSDPRKDGAALGY